MKKISFIYILFCVSLIANAQIQQEDFNTSSLPNGWSTVDSENGYTWEFGYKGALKGSGFQNPASFQSGGVIFNDSKYGDLKNNHIELIGPTIDLVKKRIVEAKIEVTYNHQTFSNDGIFRIDVWDGQTWQNILTDTQDTNANNSGENQTISIDVSSHINTNFKVRFVYDDEHALTWGIGIDDYKLTGVVSSGVDGLEGIGFTYYPNPISNGELTLRSSKEISKVNVYNSIGQRVITKKSTTFESKLNMTNLPMGAYVVQVIIGEREGNFKVIKQ